MLKVPCRTEMTHRAVLLGPWLCFVGTSLKRPEGLRILVFKGRNDGLTVTRAKNQNCVCPSPDIVKLVVDSSFAIHVDLTLDPRRRVSGTCCV